MKPEDRTNVQAEDGLNDDATPTLTRMSSRRSFLGTAALTGAAVAASAVSAYALGSAAESQADQVLEAKIRRALLSGPAVLTKDATVAEMNRGGGMTVLRQGTNKWICVPGDENRIGDPPMCADPVAMQWFADAKARRPRPTNTVPGMAYMLCGATQRSNTNPLDQTSPPIPIGPHWMILWPFDAVLYGLPKTVRDRGAWMMFADTPYAYLHICGSPWEGREYREGEPATWTMTYPTPE